MNVFGGRSNFGMGSKKPGRARRAFDGVGRSNERVEEPAEAAVAATESEPGELVRRTQRGADIDEQAHWTKRGLFKTGFNIGSPRLRGTRKFTK